MRYACSATGRTVSYDSSCLLSFRCWVWARPMWTTAARRTHTGTIFRTARARTPDQPAISQLSPCRTTTSCSSWTPTMCWYSRPLPTQPRSWPSHPVRCCSARRGGSTQSSQVRCRTQISIVTCQLTFFCALVRFAFLPARYAQLFSARGRGRSAAQLLHVLPALPEVPELGLYSG